MKSGKYIKDRLYSVCIFVAMLIISVLMMAAFKVSVQLIIAEIFIMIICYIAVVLADYYHRKKFYDELEANIAALEEKYLIRYIESIYPKLTEKYEDIYLLRNEKDFKIYSFTSGEAYQPDYVLFLKKENNTEKADYIQIFIEPKGEYLRTTDKWKEDAMKEIRSNADIQFSTQGTNFNIWGMPFFTESKHQIFDKAMRESLDI